MELVEVADMVEAVAWTARRRPVARGEVAAYDEVMYSQESWFTVPAV